MLGVFENCVYHPCIFSVAFIGEVDEADLQTNNVLGREIGPGLDDGADLVTEDVEQLDVAGDAGAVLASGEGRESVDEGGDDILDVDRGLELGAGLQEACETGEVELIRKYLY